MIVPYQPIGSSPSRGVVIDPTRTIDPSLTRRVMKYLIPRNHTILSAVTDRNHLDTSRRSHIPWLDVSTRRLFVFFVSFVVIM